MILLVQTKETEEKDMGGFIGAVLVIGLIGYVICLFGKEYRTEQKLKYEIKRQTDTIMWLESMKK